MFNIFKKSNKTAKRLAIIAGILLLLSGITGVGFIERIGWFVSTITTNYLVMLSFTILLLIASFGGLTVIVGGILIGRSKVTLGIILIRLGSGVGILSLIAQAFLAIYSKNLSITSITSIAAIGIILSVIAPFYAKK